MPPPPARLSTGLWVIVKAAYPPAAPILRDHVKIGIGALYAFNFVPRALEESYGGDPNGAMTFIRLKID